MISFFVAWTPTFSNQTLKLPIKVWCSPNFGIMIFLFSCNNPAAFRPKSHRIPTPFLAHHRKKMILSNNPTSPCGWLVWRYESLETDPQGFCLFLRLLEWSALLSDHCISISSFAKLPRGLYIFPKVTSESYVLTWKFPPPVRPRDFKSTLTVLA